jgi:(p)ppGpp synthase/HD superfamily hydrolase
MREQQVAQRVQDLASRKELALSKRHEADREVREIEQQIAHTEEIARLQKAGEDQARVDVQLSRLRGTNEHDV